MTSQAAPSVKQRQGRRGRPKKILSTSDPIDIGTKEFAHRYILKPELISASTGHSVHMRVVDETICDRLLLRNRITLQEHQLCNKLAYDLHRANFSKIPGSKLEPSSGRPDPHAMMLTDSLVEVGRLFNYLDETMGPQTRHMMTNALLDMQDIHTDSELELFRSGLLAVAVRLEKRRAKA
jgi:hypothetical protein